jgi:hypothetical protein
LGKSSDTSSNGSTCTISKHQSPEKKRQEITEKNASGTHLGLVVVEREGEALEPVARLHQGLHPLDPRLQAHGPVGIKEPGRVEASM